jgi:hypothetical protein
LTAVAAVAAAACSASPVRAAKKPATTVVGAKHAAPKGAVAVVFDRPGNTPRPLRETVVAIKGTPKTLTMTVEKITYKGVACGFTFRGARPASPVTIRMTGTAPNGGFDSGDLQVEWQPDSKQETSSASSGDSKQGWSFLSAANTDRSDATRWVVSMGSVPQDPKNVPRTVICALSSAVGFAGANGPVGYWAGFATV